MKQIYLMTAAGMLMLVCIILAVDRCRLNREFYNIGIRISEKTEQIQKNEKEYQELAAEKDQEIANLKSRFRFVTEVNILPENPLKKQDRKPESEPDKEQKTAAVPLPPFAQVTANEDDLRLIRSLVRQVPSPVTPENVKKIFQTQYLNNSQYSGKLYLTRTGVIDRDAAILEGICRELQLNARTVIYWDMDRMRHVCRTVIESPLPDDPPATVLYRTQFPLPPGKAAVQSDAVSAILPMEPAALPDNTARELLLKIHTLPVGGLYLHKIDVYQPAGNSAKEWLLEYKFRSGQELAEYAMPEPEADPAANPQKSIKPADAPVILQAVSLLPGPAVTTVWSKDRQTFRIPFSNGKSSVLIFADQVTLPESITALPFKP